MKVDIHYLTFLTEPVPPRVYASPSALLIAHFGGLKSGRMPGHRLSNPAPFLAITLPGEELTFHYPKGRDEWIMVFDSPDLRPSRRPAFVEIRADDRWIAIPRLVPFEPGDLMTWREEGARLYDAFLQPTPASRLRLTLGVSNAIRYLLDRRLDELNNTPAGRYRRLMNDPAHQRTSLAALARECGYAPDYLSALFHRQYRVSAVAYRNRRRMAIAQELIATTAKSIAEISDELGFRHVSHFSGLFRKMIGYSPREARQRLRGSRRDAKSPVRVSSAKRSN